MPNNHLPHYHDEKHKYSTTPYPSTTLPNRELPIPRNPKLYSKKSSVPESHEFIHSLRHELYNTESTFANDIPTFNPNVALYNLGIDGQPKLERSQPHSTTKSNIRKDYKQPNTINIDTTRTNPGANHSGVLPYPSLSHNPVQLEQAAPIELLYQLLLKTNTRHAQSKSGIRGHDVQ
ncbi:hypothetical protein H5410_001560 [Solanum commersonii]|uniref:Uncharacterized protein n=1 Tax=Solanum commersonii TaxID=4109 RepID=A0A9J6B005_SOLCO|nr:hypothetical protein H5410_001560 [Solanum commersonii]